MTKKTNIVELTHAAQAHIENFLDSMKEGAGFRIDIKKTGCSGYAYLVVVSSVILIGRKYVNGGYSTSFSLGYTLSQLMSAPCDMKLFDTNLNNNGDLLNANSSATSREDVVDMHAISEPPVLKNSSVICKFLIPRQNTKVSLRMAGSLPCNSRILLSASEM